MKQEIHFVTGKGGVGKSLVALSMAYKKSQAGQNVLLVELGDQSFYSDLLDEPSIGYQPRPLRPQLDVSLWRGTDCLREYALHLLKVERLYKLFFDNPISRSLINVAPALPEISIMGKITSGPRNHGPPMNYDCLVVDAYATGHFLSLIHAPYGMSKAINFGPMGEQNRSIDKTLRDPNICHYHIVTLPEELPVKESEELFAEINGFLEVKPDFYINKFLQTSLTNPDLERLAKAGSGTKDFVHYLESVIERQETSVARLKKLKTQITTLPLVMETDAWKMVETLSEGIPL